MIGGLLHWAEMRRRRVCFDHQPRGACTPADVVIQSVLPCFVELYYDVLTYGLPRKHYATL